MGNVDLLNGNGKVVVGIWASHSMWSLDLGARVATIYKGPTHELRPIAKSSRASDKAVLSPWPAFTPCQPCGKTFAFDGVFLC